jgi:outer membrane autotransporter protein
VRKNSKKPTSDCGRLPDGLLATLVSCLIGLLLLTVPTAASANNLTIKKISIGGVGTFGFASSGTSAIPSFSLTTLAENTPVSSGVIPFNNSNPGTYTFTETMPSVGWTLTSVACDGDLTGSVINSAGVAQITKLGSTGPNGGSGVCTFVNNFSTKTNSTGDTIRNFINRRLDLLASDEPDRARLQRRFDRPQQPTVSLKDEPPMKLGSDDSSSSRLSFSTSLSQIAQGNGQMKLGARDGVIVAPAYPQAPGVDVWTEGHFQRWKDDLGGGDDSGNFGILYVGADYLVNRWILIGALVQFDWMDDGSHKLNTDVSGNGWMAGPYISFKLKDNILFDARGAWGQSDNEISPLGTYKDSFDTDRWLAKANVTGNWFVKGLRISPSAGVIYVEETQHSYVDALGSTIDTQSVHIGRLTFGPEFGYAIQRPDGMVLEPHVSFTGMWDFDKDSTATIDGLAISTDDFRVKVEGGLIVLATNGVSGRATLSYDGIGTNDLTAWGGQLWLSVPWN